MSNAEKERMGTEYRVKGEGAPTLFYDLEHARRQADYRHELGHANVCIQSRTVIKTPWTDLPEIAEVSALLEELIRFVAERTAQPIGASDDYYRGRTDERGAWLAALDHLAPKRADHA